MREWSADKSADSKAKFIEINEREWWKKNLWKMGEKTDDRQQQQQQQQPNEWNKDKKLWKMQIYSSDLENLCSKLLWNCSLSLSIVRVCCVCLLGSDRGMVLKKNTLYLVPKRWQTWTLNTCTNSQDSVPTSTRIESFRQSFMHMANTSHTSSAISQFQIPFLFNDDFSLQSSTLMAPPFLSVRIHVFFFLSSISE